MQQRMVVLFLMMCTLIAATGAARNACAWNGPPTIVAPLPQPTQFTPQMPTPLNNPVLLKDLPGQAPQAVTDQSQGNSRAASGSGTTAAEPEKVKPSRPEPQPAEKPVPPPVETTVPDPAPAPSPSKTPWLLVAGGVAAAFVLGRRTK